MRLVQINENQFLNPEHVIFVDRVLGGSHRYKLTMVDGKSYSSPNFMTEVEAMEWLESLQSTTKWKADLPKGE